MQNWEIPKQFKEVSLVFCFIKWQYTSEAYSFPLKSCVSCTVTHDARSGQSKCIMEENGCEYRQTSKEKVIVYFFRDHVTMTVHSQFWSWRDMNVMIAMLWMLWLRCFVSFRFIINLESSDIIHTNAWRQLCCFRLWNIP